MGYTKLEQSRCTIKPNCPFLLRTRTKIILGIPIARPLKYGLNAINRDTEQNALSSKLDLSSLMFVVHYSLEYKLERLVV